MHHTIDRRVFTQNVMLAIASKAICLRFVSMRMWELEQIIWNIMYTLPDPQWDYL
jgi:hypothetical protein